MTESRESVQDMSFSFKYMLYLPDNRNPGEKLPLVLFLHGAGERGDDVSVVSVHGPFKRIREGWAPEFIGVAPQCPAGSHWNDNTEKLMPFLRRLISEHNADESRIYITGLSMGGFGTWAMMARWPEVFAAAVPICGGGMPWTAGEFSSVPVWAFHGSDDDIVDVRYSRDMVDAVNREGGNARLTEYSGVSHDCWTKTYESEEMWTWLLSQKKD
ncbi:MAG: prolyl oligopeptidase family serine peptidase [Eubacteriales bacterium]